MQFALEVVLKQDGDALFTDEIKIENNDLLTLMPILEKACNTLSAKLIKFLEEM